MLILELPQIFQLQIRTLLAVLKSAPGKTEENVGMDKPAKTIIQLKPVHPSAKLVLVSHQNPAQKDIHWLSAFTSKEEETVRMVKNVDTAIP